MFGSGSHIPYVCDVIIETQTITEHGNENNIKNMQDNEGSSCTSKPFLQDVLFCRFDFIPNVW